MSRRCLLITFPPGFQLRAVPGWRPLAAAALSPLASPHSKGSCHLQSPGQNYKLSLVKNRHLCNRMLVRGRFVLVPNSLNHRGPGLTLTEVGCGKQTVPRTPLGAAYLSCTINQKNGKKKWKSSCLLSPFNLLLPRKSRQSDNTVRFQVFLGGGQPL